MQPSRFLRVVLGVSILAIVLFPLYAAVSVYPAFEQALTENTTREAVRVATILSSILVEEEGRVGELRIPAGFVSHLSDLQKDTRILKVKIFTPFGRVVYSTDPSEIGRINEEEYFQRIIATGGGQAQEVEHDQPTLEKQVMPADVVETYVPIMKSRSMIGVFEIYYDVTEQKRQLRGLFRRTTGGFVALAAVLLAAVIASTRSAARVMEERKRIADDLARSEERYRALFENAGDAIFILETEGTDAGRVVAANRAAAAMHGYSVEELREMKITDLDTPDSAANSGPTIKRILDGEWVQLELSHRRKNGTVFPVEVSAGLLELGDSKYILAFDRDITVRRQVEQARERVIAELKDALEKIRTLRGLLPICASCKKIRDDKGYWNQIETYISSHTAAEFSHGLCPDCMQRLYPHLPPPPKDPVGK